MKKLPRLHADAKLPILVYYHGGGFCLGSAFNPTFHAYFNNFAALANMLVVSVEYRLAPEHPVPAAYADSWDALAWAVSHVAGAGDEPWLADHADFSRLYLGGESAGANIAHHVAMRAGAEGLPHGAKIHGLVMIHPYFLGTNKVGSDDLDAAAQESLGSLWRVMCPATTGEDDPLINPFVDGAPVKKGGGQERAGPWDYIGRTDGRREAAQASPVQHHGARGACTFAGTAEPRLGSRNHVDVGGVHSKHWGQVMRLDTS
ncbi:hypothetical protein QYE76_010391 [Lolium multiflorum]|uniref:Alpha/beta hydrolase fold-3 domain-containing protein n=1 Tax=Lolium multiflorum TaxID=4521 RepID=A0AAD8X4L2_LOLMU|nr:hypothetical protein QYE76_010391 [Lolium multiflorum]